MQQELLPMTAKDIKTWDIFCRVIDNYGDIGVCWRLARQLANEYPAQVRLWVDELDALIKIWPSAIDTNQQLLEKVDVCIWHETFDETVKPADGVIEAFACNLPDSYLAAMKRKATPPYWFNLEYLSAEDWVEGCHGLFSMHPQLGLKKMFFFPGFTTKTGGLLREASLLKERDQFLVNPANRIGFLKGLDVKPAENELIVSLFGYENTAIAPLLNTWIQSPTPILCLVPVSKVLPVINSHIGKILNVGDEFVQGGLRLKVIPFLTQNDYDRLLWACDINFVRGEDSFVRAQWAAKPFIWHIYPQDDDIHMLKLNAFLQHYSKGLTPILQSSVTALWQQWNLGLDCGKSWSTCIEDLQNWQQHSQNWSESLSSLGDVVSNMVHCCD
jgi:uncharacterized repeat protein (TIGR03837 family)